LYYPIQLPIIPGVEAAGVVAAVGSAVTDFRVGDRVAYAGYMGGNYAEYTAVPQDRLVPVPDALPLEQAAASLMQGQTAYVLTHQVYSLKGGEFAVIHAAAGGVGLWLVQMAKQLGAVVVGTTSSILKADAARAAGADHVFLYDDPAIDESVLKLTDGQGVHVVYDGVGGAMFEKSLGLLRTRGYLVEYGQSGGQPLPFDITRLSGITGSQNRGSLFVTWASASDYLTTPEASRTCAEVLFSSMIDGSLQTYITDVFPLEDAPKAHQLLESRTISGKLLLKI
jgi:NADPH:quinone reductase